MLPLSERMPEPDRLHDAHEHVPMTLVEQIDAAELPEALKESYALCLQYIQK